MSKTEEEILSNAVTTPKTREKKLKTF